MNAVSAKLSYTDGVLKISDSSLNSAKTELFPMIGEDAVYTFSPVTGENAIFFNAGYVSSAYNSSEEILVSVSFDVVSSGSANITIDIDELYNWDTTKNTPYSSITDYNVIDRLTAA